MKFAIAHACILLLVTACGANRSGSAGTDGMTNEDGDGNRLCSKASACGGDIVGTWKFISTCLTRRSGGGIFFPDCPEETQNIDGETTDGTVTYAADGTYTRHTVAGGTFVVTAPSSCLMRGSMARTCAQFEEVVLDSQGWASASCKDQNGSCTCTMEGIPVENMESGAYQTVSGTLIEGSPAQAASSYCVSSSRLTLWPIDYDALTPQLTGSVTLTRQ